MPLTQPSFDLAGRIALVTGSSRGIGLTFAEALAGAGAEVVLNGRHQADLESARARLASAGVKVHARVFDVTDQAAIGRAIEDIEAEIGPIAILFNNAGIQRRGPLAEYDPATWRELMSANLDSVFYVSQVVARRMIERKSGKIVNTCSLNSEVGRPTIAPYAASKGAVKMLTKAMCVEWAPHGIQVNGIGPGYFKTELNRALYTDPAFDEWLRKRTPAGRWGELDELKGVAVFLAADASNYVNGQIIYVDGGTLSTL
jgi:gluconate 5-dehydrogenase